MSYQKINDAYFKDDYNSVQETNKIKVNKNDYRPEFNGTNKVVDDLKKKESIESTITKTKLSSIQLKGNSTIFDESFKSITGNMIDKVSTFGEDFKSALVSVKYEYDMNNTNDEDYQFSDLVHIHFLAFIKYMDNGPSIAYIGVFFVFISFIIYIFNILLKK
tara:strand:- start:1182 stop:1667 length:486 start_codon:yes stop_codon:yes gene_type:complete